MSAGNPKRANNYTSQNKVQLIRGGKPYFDRLLEMINKAQESIHLQTYIYDDDDTGKEVAGALKEAVKRKVEVYLVADGYASRVMGTPFIHSLKEAGIHFRFFNPLFKSKRFYFGRRLHHKVVVVDTKYAMVGGVNISNRYNDMPGNPAWLDFALYVEGEAAKELCVLCWKTWKNYPVNMGLTPCEEKEIPFNFSPAEICEVAMRRNDWVRRKNEISSTYVNMFRGAKSHITILCSYFLPGRVIRNQLRYAVSRGVKIKVITAGASDVVMAKYAERFMYDWLLRNNIELYEYQPSILHGKIAVCDSQWMTIGSYNINNISAYASIELNMNVRNEMFAKQAEQVLLQIADKDCVRVTKEYYKKTNNIFKQFTHWCSYEFIRLIFYLFTFYFRHRN
ncbi:MAG: phospholipase D-like domain-containing protein [Bacteroidota bacterium]|nr:phospholipase D-like domain-containing protein [Bacteroidota bacterium]